MELRYILVMVCENKGLIRLLRFLLCNTVLNLQYILFVLICSAIQYDISNVLSFYR